MKNEREREGLGGNEDTPKADRIREQNDYVREGQGEVRDYWKLAFLFFSSRICCKHFSAENTSAVIKSQAFGALLWARTFL